MSSPPPERAPRSGEPAAQDGGEAVSAPPSFRNPFLDLLGAVDDGVGPGWARVALDSRPELTNMHGKVHGGVLMTLLDTTMARAAMARQGFRLSVVSIGVTASFLSPGSGRLRVQARAIGGGRSTCFCEAEILDAEGRIVAKGVGTFKYRKPPQGGATPPESIE
ncbi:PaaI family thioesterase [Thauera butanivorans]|uniref:PaaI family thioesterase n=1 Tax=Thauera butanivorans TaxID=86174 RepID=UPI000837C927|nr:PaaI family thioesterase [Thauera butanivorans]